MNKSMMVRIKELEAKIVRVKKIYVEERLKTDFLKPERGNGKNVLRPFRRHEIAK